MVEVSTSSPLAATQTQARARARFLYIGFGVLGTLAVLGARLALATRVEFCGWRDACFYYTLARQLVNHHGFVMPFVWNYQVGNIHLPNPAVQYWRPGMSLILALPSLFGGGVTLFSAAVMNAVATVLLSLSAAWLAWRTIGDRMATLLAYLLCLTLAPLWSMPLTPDSALFYAVAVAWFLALVSVERSSLGVELVGVTLIGVAYFIRNDAIVLVASLAGIITIRLFAARGGGVRRELRRAGALAIAFVLALLPTHVLLAVVNGHFLNSAIDHVIFLHSRADFRHFGGPVDFATWTGGGVMPLLKVRLAALIATLRGTFLLCGQFPTLLALLGAGIVATRRRRDYGGRFLGPVLFLVALAGAYILVLPVIADHAVPRSFTALLPAFAVLAVIAVREVARSARTVAAVVGVAALLSVVHGLGVARGEFGQFHALRQQYLAEARLMKEHAGTDGHILAMVEDPAPFTTTTGVPSVPLPSNGMAATQKAITHYNVTDVVVSEWHGGRALAAVLNARRITRVPDTTELVIAVPSLRADPLKSR
jgi:4-amino-4-deoxy-L-arabinose transferase-like glycosyltransferase